MKLIIYLLSHDPDAQTNHNRLLVHRAKQPDFFDNQLLDIENNRVVLAEAEETNVFVSLKPDQRLEVSVELIAHGIGDNRVRGFSSRDDWSTDISRPNLIPGILPEKLRDFFKEYAFGEGKYKFSELTLFCCNSYEFGKNLAMLMPEIKVACFKEFIRVDKDGKAYPYIKEGNNVRRIDRNGNVLIPLQYDAVTDKLLNYYPAPLRVFEGSSEKIIYACSDALPDNLRLPNMQSDPRPITIRINSLTREGVTRPSQHVGDGATDPQQNVNPHSISSSNDSEEEKPRPSISGPK